MLSEFAGSLRSIDLVTGAVEWSGSSLPYPYRTLAAGDANGDDVIELWAAATFSGQDQLDVFSPGQASYSWATRGRHTAVGGPFFGDFDGNGDVELLITSDRIECHDFDASNGFYSAGASRSLQAGSPNPRRVPTWTATAPTN